MKPYPGCFTPGKEIRYPLYRRLSGPQDLSGWVREVSPPPRFDPWTAQPIAVIENTVINYTGVRTETRFKDRSQFGDVY